MKFKARYITFCAHHDLQQMQYDTLCWSDMLLDNIIQLYVISECKCNTLDVVREITWSETIIVVIDK